MVSGTEGMGDTVKCPESWGPSQIAGNQSLVALPRPPIDRVACCCCCLSSRHCICGHREYASMGAKW